MQELNYPQTYVLRGEEAIEALNEYINEITSNTPEELTENQTNIMVKLAQSLIQAIEDEDLHVKSKNFRFTPKVKQTIENLFSFLKSVSTSSESHETNQDSDNYYCPSPNRIL